MPAAVNIGANLMFGAALVLAVRRSPSLRQNFVGWVFFFLLGFEALLFTPVSTYLFRFYPQWSMLYWFDPQVFPDLHRWIGWLSALAVLLNFGAAILGFFLARLGILTGQTWLWSVPLAVASAVMAYVLFGFWDRIIYIGDHDSFWSGNASSLFSSLSGWIGILLYAALITFVVWIHRRFHDHDPSFL
jgi:hypothetical protein